MPRIKQQLRRQSAIVQVLNNNIGRWTPTTEIMEKVIVLCGEQFCKSTIEKDLFYLKEEFDLEYESTSGLGGGILINERVDFVEMLKAHLNIF